MTVVRDDEKWPHIFDDDDVEDVKFFEACKEEPFLYLGLIPTIFWICFIVFMIIWSINQPCQKTKTQDHLNAQISIVDQDGNTLYTIEGRVYEQNNKG